MKILLTHTIHVCCKKKYSIQKENVVGGSFHTETNPRRSILSTQFLLFTLETEKVFFCFVALFIFMRKIQKGAQKNLNLLKYLKAISKIIALFSVLGSRKCSFAPLNCEY